MFDEQDRLRESPQLLRLLTHYGEVGAADREAWQDRLMQLDGVEPKELSRLHGELIASSWVEQNTGVTPDLKPGVAAACYRITAMGRRALKRAARPCDDEEDLAEAA